VLLRLLLRTARYSNRLGKRLDSIDLLLKSACPEWTPDLYICYSVDVASEEIPLKKYSYSEELSVKEIHIHGAVPRGTILRGDSTSSIDRTLQQRQRIVIIDYTVRSFAVGRISAMSQQTVSEPTASAQIMPLGSRDGGGAS
jgi:hypothetical protein